MRNISNNSPNENLSTMTGSSNSMNRNSLSKLRVIMAIGALMSLTACSGYTSHLSEGVSAMPTYPVVQF